jgi:hypothetical protein
MILLKRALSLAAICLLCSQMLFAQYVKNPKQEKAATDFMLLLANRQVDQAIRMIGLPSNSQKAEVLDAADQIDQLRGRAELSIEAVPNGKASLYEARYLIRSEHFQDFFKVDILFPNAKTNKISVVRFHHRAELMKEPPSPPPHH